VCLLRGSSLVSSTILVIAMVFRVGCFVIANEPPMVSSAVISKRIRRLLQLFGMMMTVNMVNYLNGSLGYISGQLRNPSCPASPA
jgi:hypothetical protein